ncbi:MAG: diacylglycerol/lipid kinase family protein, partial [Brevinematales bacterium]
MAFLSQASTHHEVTTWATEGNNHATLLAEKAYRLGYREFVCIGGDGTFNEMCQPLVGRNNIRVSLIPAGTGNDLAFGLGFSSSFVPQEWSSFFRDEAVSIDVGKCNERYFFNTMGIGFDALVASEFRHWLWLPRKWRYYLPIFKNLLFYKGYKLAFDGKQQDVFLVSIGNGRSSGGG